MDAEGNRSIAVNPAPGIRRLLEEPNPYMTGQVMQEKLATQLCLNNNAFALIVRDDMGAAHGNLPDFAADSGGVVQCRRYAGAADAAAKQ